eukprot:Rhum_TRINITY_DN12973_c0_g1::Rhum_TRINITY_DN12973_c0_g1_i1::g.55809::m.55809/K03524/birA; BirA family transcriptional regulator, biotin operon repressor / biotin-[acetyl-CoA-carboxylase] ligase
MAHTEDVVGEDVFARYTTTSSTMDRAKELCKAYGPDKWVLVTAAQQESGRGTNGRTWVSPAGNAFISICVPKSQSVLPIARLAYLPLETGIAVVNGIKAHMPADAVSVLPKRDNANLLSLKWPNDVLLNDLKVSGNLIEDGGSHMIVGIGVNVAAAPEVKDGGRTAGCLAPYGFAATDEALARSIFRSLKGSLLNGAPDAGMIVLRYSSMIDFKRSVHERNKDGTRGDECLPLRLTDEGHLVVRHLATKQEKTLISEYLF